ncbi:MAG: hypothetical protein U1F87_15540 [Kiritimatiellia bacterium]
MRLRRGAWRETRHQTLATIRHQRDIFHRVDVRPTALILGCRRLDLDPRMAGPGPCKIRIPMLGQADSSNVSAACTCVLYEAVRQRKYSG